MKTKALCITGILAALVCARPAHAAVVMTLEQVGPDVVATGSGTVDTTGLGLPSGGGGYAPQIVPPAADLLEGNGLSVDIYSGVSGPGNFGTGGGIVASTGTGDPLGIAGGASEILVPAGYTSNTLLSSTATFDNTTLAALGATPGIYTWTWGSVAAGDADSLTLYIGVAAPTSVPEPAPALLLTLGAAALVLLKRIKK